MADPGLSPPPRERLCFGAGLILEDGFGECQQISLTYTLGYNGRILYSTCVRITHPAGRGAHDRQTQGCIALGQRARWKDAGRWSAVPLVPAAEAPGVVCGGVVGVLVVGVVIAVIVLQIDPSGVCEKIGYPGPDMPWCRAELRPPFDAIVPSCEELGGLFEGRGDVRQGPIWVLSAEGRSLFPAASAGRHCSSRDGSIDVQVIEFRDAEEGRTWLEEEADRLISLEMQDAEVYFRDFLPPRVPIRNMAPDAISYTYDDYVEQREDPDTPYAEEGALLISGRYGIRVTVRRQSPPKSREPVSPDHGIFTYFVGSEYIDMLYRAIDLTVPRVFGVAEG